MERNELITSVLPITPSKGTNAGKQMFLINGHIWSKVEPSQSDTHIKTEDVTIGEGESAKTYTNFVGFNRAEAVAYKVGLITKYDIGYSMALATLLK